MNYLKHYCNLIRKAEKRTPPEGYTEKHHVFPKSIFGKNSRIVKLTAKEHYVAHALLERICIQRYGENHWKSKKMNHAHILMRGVGNRKEIYYNSYIYEGAKIRNSKILTGFFALSEEEQRKIRSKNGNISGNKNIEEKRGIFSQTDEERRKIASLGGKAVKELKIGIFSMSKEEWSEVGKKGAAVTNSQKWKCLETGFITTPGNLSQYQRARGIDTSKRERLH
jgi:general stress protein YciG